jgi:hypothetical protein
VSYVAIDEGVAVGHAGSRIATKTATEIGPQAAPLTFA